MTVKSKDVTLKIHCDFYITSWCIDTKINFVLKQSGLLAQLENDVRTYD